MNKNDLARDLARLSHRSHAKAADDLDQLVYRLLKELKRSQTRDEIRGSAFVVAPVPRPSRDS